MRATISAVLKGLIGTSSSSRLSHRVLVRTLCDKNSKEQKSQEIKVVKHTQDELNDDESKSKLDILSKELQKNLYYDKYKDKIQTAQKASPREFLALLEQTIGNKIFGSRKPTSAEPSPVPKKSLNEIMNVSMLENLDRDDIVFIWQEYHKGKEKLGAAIRRETYKSISELGRKHNLFLLPLPRQDGYEFFYTQYLDDSFHLTSLQAYKMYKENAPECLSITNFVEMMESKDLVLMRGEYDKNMLNEDEARCLASQVYLYYGTPSESRLNIMSKFTKSQEDFDHFELIDEFKKLKEEHENAFSI